VRQKRMRGTAHAIYLAKEFVGNNPFVVLYPDDIFLSEVPVSRQLITTYKKTKKTVLAAMKVEKSQISRFASIKGNFDDIITVQDIVEKPKPEEAPSNYASMGRYLFLPEIFEVFKHKIEHQPIGEVYQTDGIQVLAKQGNVVACEIDAEFLDTGVPLALLKSSIRYTLKQKEHKEDLMAFLEDIMGTKDE